MRQRILLVTVSIGDLWSHREQAKGNPVHMNRMRVLIKALNDRVQPQGTEQGRRNRVDAFGQTES